MKIRTVNFELVKILTCAAVMAFLARAKKHVSTMALNLDLATAEHNFLRPFGILSSSISPAAIKQANKAEKSTLTYAQTVRGMV